MKLIVGLGNPGSKYEKNRHNIGFLAVDYLIKEFNATKLSSKFKGELYKSDEYLFLKPTTYMNLSGESVRLVKDFYKIENDDIIVIHDDIDLKLGALRFKKGGGSGGHNGLKSIDANIGNDYWRVRIGVGRPERKEMVVSYVLSDFEDEELECLEKLFPLIKEAIKDIKNAPSRYSKKGC
ncbi:aminoacyl-tRNA hydrolase [Caminibacter pacificus]|uniref:Peptidyl-tRNA hydrolase n=1 Tax=Caminibacter pacificus TaxID=1424653 RepID=A0AAJ4RC61_9BACT|nr:aminoacyl-tRNA hydrolase [Caminibacter pacificus]QCI27989.1 aminoacyl-tRNA hydrolase [Caminibacter pacificus]ROR39825.1 PTH1 family peptidyl-tRNA hydrolase [Caminibacter pacificus]